MLAPGAHIDGWEVISFLGRGGMAVVYAVRHADGRERALKVLHHAGPDAATRLRREAAIQNALRHENVVAVDAVLEVDGRPAFVMAHVPGRTLAEWLDEGHHDEATVSAVFRGICAGVAHAHAQGVVHRDLKPSNVLLDESRSPPVPRIADFGVAKAQVDTDERLTRTGMGLGTPQYMAPEQIRDAAHVDARADVWALGCLLYELATGRRLLESTDPIALYQAAMQRRWVPLRTLRPDVPQTWVTTLEAALEGRLDGRAPDAEALLAVFEGAPWLPPARVEAGEPSESPPTTHPSWGGALPWALVLGGLLVVAVVLLTARPRAEMVPAPDGWRVEPLAWEVAPGRPAHAVVPDAWVKNASVMTHGGRRIWSDTLRGAEQTLVVQRYEPGLGMDLAGFVDRHEEVSGIGMTTCEDATLRVGPHEVPTRACVDADGDRYHFVVRGDDDGQVLLLAHGDARVAPLDEALARLSIEPAP